MFWRVVLIAALCITASGQTAGEKLVVSGVVIDGLTGGPLDRAMVALMGDRGHAGGRKMTGPDGRFSFEVQGAGATLQVWRRGYRFEKSAQDVATVHLTQERLAGPVTVKLMPQGVVMGRVVDQYGEPLMGLTVQLITSIVEEGRRNSRAYASSTTNDLGEFRMWHLRPGDYYLKVLGRRGVLVGMGEMPGTGLSAEAYGPVYYPSASTQAEAELIKLAPGETKQADFQVVGHAAYRVRGVLRNFTPYRQATLTLRRGLDTLGNRVKLDVATGAFEMEDVAPGSYTVEASMSGTERLLMGNTAITVGEGDLRGVQVVLSGGVKAGGSVRWSGEGHLPVVITARKLGEGGALETGFKAVARAQERIPDFSFEYLIPGRYQVEVRPIAGAGWYASSVRSGSRDVLEEGWVVTEAGAEPLEVAMTQGAGRLEVKHKGDADDGDVQIAAVRRTGPFIDAYVDYMPTGGAVKLMTLPPGDYRVYAWRRDEPLEYLNPAVLNALEDQSVRVSMAGGAMEKIEVQVPKRSEAQ